MAIVIRTSWVKDLDEIVINISVANRILNTNNGHMRLAAPSEKVYSLIKITQLDRVLPVFDTVADAFDDLKKIN